MQNKIVALLVMLISSSANAATWTYKSALDEMSGKSLAQAYAVSDNSLKLDFPYQGANKAFLVIRDHPLDGLGVVFTIEKGQILCHTDCSVMVRFDDGPVIELAATRPTDQFPKVIFIDDVEKFIAAAARAKTILIQPTLYQNGAPVLRFKFTQPLRWPSQ